MTPSPRKTTERGGRAADGPTASTSLGILGERSSARTWSVMDCGRGSLGLLSMFGSLVRQDERMTAAAPSNNDRATARRKRCGTPAHSPLIEPKHSSAFAAPSCARQYIVLTTPQAFDNLLQMSSDEWRLTSFSDH